MVDDFLLFDLLMLLSDTDKTLNIKVENSWSRLKLSKYKIIKVLARTFSTNVIYFSEYVLVSF